MLMLDDVRIKDNIFNTRKVFANGKLAFKFRSSSYEYYIPSANGEYMWGPFELKSLYVDGKKCRLVRIRLWNCTTSRKKYA